MHAWASIVPEIVVRFHRDQILKTYQKPQKGRLGPGARGPQVLAGRKKINQMGEGVVERKGGRRGGKREIGEGERGRGEERGDV